MAMAIKEWMLVIPMGMMVFGAVLAMRGHHVLGGELAASGVIILTAMLGLT
jgi:hypothetical protein